MGTEQKTPPTLEIKLGEMLKDMEKSKGGNSLLFQPVYSENQLATLKEIGISKNLAFEAQALASLPEDDQIKVKTGFGLQRAKPHSKYFPHQGWGNC